MISVIIPTRNRAAFLKDALKSILEQTLSQEQFEVIVVDNGSTDNTSEVVRETDISLGRIKYLYAPEPGLHVGRHAGAKNAVGDILVFIDDDILTTPTWLEAIKTAFDNPDIVLVGGKILPKWEGEVPAWIDIFKDRNRYGWVNGYLSLLDFGDAAREIPSHFVYGCNFSIRKATLYECGGFHPDGMPQELIRYRGDGETGLSRNITAKGYKARYEPKALIYHRVPPERLTIEYFCKRAFNDGVLRSYSEIRKNRGLTLVEKKEAFNIINWVRDIFMRHPLKRKIKKQFEYGREYHRRCVSNDPELLAHVLREMYY